MTRKRRPKALLSTAAALAVAPLAIAACGGGATASTTPPKTTTSPVAEVATASTGLGTILVDAQGRTLYLFKGDSGTTSTCTGACATAWPPLVASGTPTAGSGANSSLLGTTKRADGTVQVTYHGHPLYTFVNDVKPGQTNGQGLTAFGAAWFALTPSGNAVGQPASSAGAGANRPASPATTTPKPAPVEPRTTPEPAPKPAPEPAPKAAPPAPKPAPPAAGGIPQNNGGDGDADNNGGPSDGDGEV